MNTGIIFQKQNSSIFILKTIQQQVRYLNVFCYKAIFRLIYILIVHILVYILIYTSNIHTTQFKFIY